MTPLIAKLSKPILNIFLNQKLKKKHYILACKKNKNKKQRIFLLGR